LFTQATPEKGRITVSDNANYIAEYIHKLQ